MPIQDSRLTPNAHAGAGTGYGGSTRFPTREPQAGDWISRLLEKPTPRVDVMLPLHLYRDFQVIAAGREVREGRIGSAITHLNFAARACFDLGENLSCNRLLDRADAAQIDLVNGLGKGPTSKLGKRGTLSRYFLVLQGEASEAVQRGELNRTRDLLRQLVVLGKNMGDRRTVNDYKSRLRSIETVYSLKGTRSVTLQRVFWSRFIYALKEATLRRELAFREPFANHVSAIQLVLAPTLPPLISA